jgi:hypothetical protein
MTDAEWLRKHAASGWFNDEHDREIIALLRRAADGLDELGRLKAELPPATTMVCPDCGWDGDGSHTQCKIEGRWRKVCPQCFGLGHRVILREIPLSKMRPKGDE